MPRHPASLDFAAGSFFLAVVEAWSDLPPAVRAGILAMVQASRPVKDADD